MYFDSVLNLFTNMYCIPISGISFDGFFSFAASLLFFSQNSCLPFKEKANIYDKHVSSASDVDHCLRNADGDDETFAFVLTSSVVAVV